MEVGVLGPVEARLGDQPLELGTPKQRAVLAALALERGRPVSVDTIVDLLWGQRPPPGVTGTLQAYVSGLRRVLEPRRERRAPATVLVTVAPGYALRVGEETLDVARFERIVTAEDRRLQDLGTLSGTDLTSAVERLDQALALWRGTPYAELDDAPTAVAERTRLEELRLAALEHRVAVSLALGRHATLTGELEALTATYPLRERLWAMRAVALFRSGRQAEALDAIATLRRLLDEELGLEPSRDVRDLQTALLRQDDSLLWKPPAPGRVEVGPARSEPVPPADAPTSAASGFSAPWRIVGRDGELETLTAALTAATGGVPSFAVLTGDAGIGKTRLAGELVERARALGARVLTGRGSQVDGAPPLWPWTTVLEGLGEPLPEIDVRDDDGSQFRAWEQIARCVRRAATARPTVLWLDDLHWADSSSLRVLRLLVETAEAERLLLLATWRPQPEASPALADLAEALARRHATRLELAGLGAEDSAEVFAEVGGGVPSPAQAEAIRARTSGNPFFLVEYARLAGARGDIDRLLEESPPTAVQEVIARRMARLPAATLAALRTAAVIGQAFDTPTLAQATGVDEDDLLDALDPAQAAGLVTEEGVGRCAFEHALVRDVLYTGLPASRRAREHARIAAAMEQARDRETERAMHWLAAGPAYATKARHACLDAAQVAHRLQAREDRAVLLESAIGLMRTDPSATIEERYDALMQLADAYRWLVRWNELAATVLRAVDVARELGDPVRLARAAASLTEGALWEPESHGAFTRPVIDALRESLDRLPPEDSPLRCRVLVALAMELYAEAAYDERRRLVDEARAMASRIGDDDLLLHTLLVATPALWKPSTMADRLALSTQAVALAERTGNRVALVSASAQRAIALNELGRRAETDAARDAVRGPADELRLHYPRMVVEALGIPWLALGGHLDQAREVTALITELGDQVSLPGSNALVVGCGISILVWSGEFGQAARTVMELPSSLPVSSSVAALLCRAGEVEEARAYRDAHPFELDADDWFSLLNWSHAAEAAAYLGDAALGAAMYDRLLPYAGCNSCAGSGNTTGPIDRYLALAAFATGDVAAATAHAREADRLTREWHLPVLLALLDDQRHLFGF
ncbi:BTAD domain-containing putative transcriptional regulator [Nocardioides sp. CER19]|uniref:BTAD domain-containing putative transcriptional regulator n=1 Tax=Nocardioides sp. CER19 TaxID=3038538 RepID=UPI002448890C|nr:BTAD domain-containing putative transcriptional regulator [Nocardioides sp. CER19]MDH2412700.1 BTAD domain-containing putative transcriptional regulator [Nocardioides sp. CER19]